MEPKDSPAKQIIDHERQEVLQQLEEWLEVPMLILSFLWLTLLIAEFLWGLGLWQERIGTGIWVVFILDFAVKFSLAPRKRAYLRNNWLTIIALAVPALRLFRIAKLIRVLRITRAARGLRLVRFITSLNRGMKALGASMGRRGFGYVMTLTLIVLFSGAAGMYRFENEAPAGGFDSYGTALWWTAMLLASTGPVRPRAVACAFCWRCTDSPSSVTSPPPWPASSWTGMPRAMRRRWPAPRRSCNCMTRSRRSASRCSG
jgi:voltage-gated potassium channel